MKEVPGSEFKIAADLWFSRWVLSTRRKRDWYKT